MNCFDLSETKWHWSIVDEKQSFLQMLLAMRSTLRKSDSFWNILELHVFNNIPGHIDVVTAAIETLKDSGEESAKEPAAFLQRMLDQGQSARPVL